MNNTSDTHGILSGPLRPAIWKLALPAIASGLLMSANSIADKLFMGRLGVDALAIVTVVHEVRLALMTILVAFSVGAAAIIGRAIGAGNKAEATAALRQTVLVSVVIGSVIGGIVAIFAPALLQTIGYRGDPNSFNEGVKYLRWSMLAVPSLFTLVIGNTVFGVLGESRRALQVIAVAVALNILFDYILIFGMFGFPRMGVTGGGAALCISQTIATLLFVVFLPETGLNGWLQGSWVPDSSMLKRILHVGLPASARQAVVALSGLTIQALLLRTQSGSAAGAAHGIGVLVESLAFLPGNAFATTAGTFVSQNLGARNLTRAKDAALVSIGQAVLTMTLAGAAFGLLAAGLAQLMLPSSASDAVDLATRYLHLMAFIQPAVAVNLVLAGVLSSAGDTRTPRTVTFVTTGLRVLLAYALSTFTGLGVMGVWLGVASTPIISMALLIAAYRRGNWASTKV